MCPSEGSGRAWLWPGKDEGLDEGECCDWIPTRWEVQILPGESGNTLTLDGVELSLKDHVSSVGYSWIQSCCWTSKWWLGPGVLFSCFGQNTCCSPWRTWPHWLMLQLHQYISTLNSRSCLHDWGSCKTTFSNTIWLMRYIELQGLFSLSGQGASGEEPSRQLSVCPSGCPPASSKQRWSYSGVLLIKPFCCFFPPLPPILFFLACYYWTVVLADFMGRVVLG